MKKPSRGEGSKKVHKKTLMDSLSSFSTIHRKRNVSYIMICLNSTNLVIPIGVSGHFWAVAYVCIGASPNKSYSISTN